MRNKVPDRRLIAVAGILMQAAMGAVYAWSVFRLPLMRSYGWTVSQVTMVFELAIFMLGVSAFAGGLWIKRSGPRPVAIAGGLCYGLGVVLAGRTGGHLALLYLTYGVLGGIGLGLGYIVPVTTLLRWFPDRRGMITGLAVAGFGSGALVTAPVAQALISRIGVADTFTVLGVLYLAMVCGSAALMRNPPEGYSPAGWKPLSEGSQGSGGKDFALGEALRTWQWYALWAILFLNTLAGIALISQASPLAQELTHVSAAAAAGLVGIISIANGAGRFLWSWASDFIGRRRVFIIMFILQAIAFALLARTHSFAGLTVLAFAVLLCYGGGFGTMPALTADYFGTRNVGSVYGLMLTAWGCAGLVGPALIAFVREATGCYTWAFVLTSGILVAGAALTLAIRRPRSEEQEATPAGNPSARLAMPLR